ncbi:hypothetical protein PkP19E3_21365 [Pseudomonas koreensis]|nr:hypothetical protein PkP19E3_21365 [Pseudomonas koreensis]
MPIACASTAFRASLKLTLTPCRSCRRLRSFDLDLKKQNQKIAAFGSSYSPGFQFKICIFLLENDLHLY